MTKQIAVNHTALMNMAGRLEALGFTGDAYEVAERLAMNLLADGYRPVGKPVAASGPGASRESIEAAKEAARAAVDAAKRRITGRADT